MNRKVTVTPRWYGPVPTRNGKPLPKNQWARAGRKRRWTVRWYAPDGSRPRQTFDTKAEADDFADAKVAEFGAKGPQARVRCKQVTLGAFVDELLRLRVGPRGERLAISSLNEYRTIMNRFKAFVGRDTPLDCIGKADAARYIADIRRADSARGKPLSLSSVNKHKSVLKSAFNVAVEQLGYLKANPFPKLKKDVIADQALRDIEPGEYRALVKACGSYVHSLWWECFLAVSYTAGTRLNETVHLAWTDVDFENGTIRVIAKPELDGMPAWRPKGKRSRTIPIPESTVSLLSRMHAEAEPGSQYVFLSPKRVAWIRAKQKAGEWREGAGVLNNVNTDFKRRAKKAGVKDVSIHDLRRSCISHWARKLPATIVQELAGHQDIKTTLQSYVSVRDEDLAEAREVIAKALATDTTQGSDTGSGASVVGR